MNFRTVKRFDYIDALRGYAVLGVIVVHVVSAAPIADGVLKTLLQQGARGVQLFYVVSAFTLAMSWNSRNDGRTAFYLRRLFRIAPMYWFAIPLYLSFAGLREGYFAPQTFALFQIATTFTFMSAIFPILPVVPGGLTVTTEVALYALFPLLIIVVRNRVIAAVSLVAATCLAKWLYEPSMSLFLHLGAERAYVGVFAFFFLPYQLPVFLAGIAAYLFSQLTLPSRMLMVLLTLSCIALFVLPFLREILPLHIEYGIAFACILVCLANGTGRSIVLGPIQNLGKLSFSAYLLHFAVFNILYLAWDNGYNPLGLGSDGSPWRLLPLLVFVLAITSCVSYYTHALIEQPMIKLGNRLVASLSNNCKTREQIG